MVPVLEVVVIVILGNLAKHKNADAAKVICEAEIGFLVLPPYSLEQNAIDMAFSKLQAHLSRIGARTVTEMFSAPSEFCRLYTTNECRNYFKAV